MSFGPICVNGFEFRGRSRGEMALVQLTKVVTFDVHVIYLAVEGDRPRPTVINICIIFNVDIKI